MRKQEVSLKTIICVNSECFGDTSGATRHVLELASQGQKVTVTRRVEAKSVRLMRDI